MALAMASYAKIKLFGTDPRGTLWSFQLWAYLEAPRVAGRAGSTWRHLLPRGGIYCLPSVRRCRLVGPEARSMTRTRGSGAWP